MRSGVTSGYGTFHCEVNSARFYLSMFFVDDNQESRHLFIRNHLSKETASIAMILASIDFEWTLRRAILSLGRSPTKEIREKLKRLNGGYEKYKTLWNGEVYPRIGLGLDKVVRNWSKLHGKGSASEARGAIVHGASVPVSVERATIHVQNWLAGSRMIESLALKHGGASLFRRIVRFKSR